MVRFLAALGLLLGIGAAQAQPIYFGGASGGGGGGCTVSGTQFDILAVDNTGSGCHADSAATVNAGALTLGASGTLGTITLGNATSGTILFTPPTGALGSKTQTFQDVTDTFAYLGTAQTYTAAQTFTNSDLLLLGSSTGATTFTSANAGASNFTITFPAATDTVAMLAATQTFTNKTLTSPALGGTVTGSPTFSGNLTFSGATLTMSGLTSGTVAANSYIGLDASNHLVLGSGGGGGGSLTITDGTHSQTGVTTASLGVGLVTTNGSSGTGPITLAAPVRTVTTSPTVLASDMSGQINSNVTGGGTLTIPAISSTVFPAGATLAVVNYSASTEAVTTTPIVNAGGGCVTATGIPSGDSWQMLSNGVSIDCFQTISTAGSGAVTSVANSDGTLTISPTTGSVVASLALGHANTWSGQQTFVAPVLGTIASGVATNLTGTAAGLTAGTASAAPVSGLTGAGTGVVTALGTALSAAGGLSSTIASGTSALGTGAISSATCATVVTTTATNTATTDVIWWGFNGDPTGVVGYEPATAGMLTIIAYPSANNVNFKVCNNTSSSVTPGAITLNWRVIR